MCDFFLILKQFVTKRAVFPPSRLAPVLTSLSNVSAFNNELVEDTLVQILVNSIVNDTITLSESNPEEDNSNRFCLLYKD